MSWNHRVMKLKVENDPFMEFEYGIHEVYYDLTTGKPNGYIETPCEVSAESFEGLKWVLEKMSKALEQPILTEQDFIYETDL